MSADILDFIAYLNKKGKKGTRALSLADMKELCRIDDDSLSWISSLFAFARYTLFLKTLLHDNISRGKNPNTGFLVGFSDDHIESMGQAIIDALSQMGQSFCMVDAAGKKPAEIISELSGVQYRNQMDAFQGMEDMLYESDKVFIIKRFSLSKSPSKSSTLRCWIKILDDAHTRGVVPKANLVLVDNAGFLQKAWSDIGSYLNIMAYSDNQTDMFS